MFGKRNGIFIYRFGRRVLEDRSSRHGGWKGPCIRCYVCGTIILKLGWGGVSWDNIEVSNFR